MTDLLEELQWRGMLNDTTPGTEEQLKKEMTTGYIGFDPTAPSLHIGNLAAIMLLKHLQRAGHKPIALIGGATGMIGDPSGKSEERKLLSEDELRYNEQCIKEQLKNFLDFDCGENSAELCNNYDWFRDYGFINFLRDVGKHISINYMTAKDTVKSRLESGLSFTEFSYQLLQAYDFYWLNQSKGCKLQLGGSDQWGNITTGIELIRRKADEEGYAITCPLITRTDGAKFGKSEEGNVWLAPEWTSPYKFYQFWLNCRDEDAPRLIRVFTLRSKEEIEELERQHQEAPHKRILQEAIAKDVTTTIHSQEAYETAVTASRILFGKSTTEDLQKLDEDTLLNVFEGVPMSTVSRENLQEINTAIDLISHLTEAGIFESKGEARRMIKNGGLQINKQKVTSQDQEANFGLLQDRYMLVQKGKKNYYLVKAE